MLKNIKNKGGFIPQLPLESSSTTSAVEKIKLNKLTDIEATIFKSKGETDSLFDDKYDAKIYANTAKNIYKKIIPLSYLYNINKTEIYINKYYENLYGLETKTNYAIINNTAPFEILKQQIETGKDLSDCDFFMLEGDTLVPLLKFGDELCKVTYSYNLLDDLYLKKNKIPLDKSTSDALAADILKFFQIDITDPNINYCILNSKNELLISNLDEELFLSEAEKLYFNNAQNMIEYYKYEIEKQGKPDRSTEILMNININEAQMFFTLLAFKNGEINGSILEKYCGNIDTEDTLLNLYKKFKTISQEVPLASEDEINKLIDLLEQIYGSLNLKDINIITELNDFISDNPSISYANTFNKEYFVDRAKGIKTDNGDKLDKFISDLKIMIITEANKKLDNKLEIEDVMGYYFRPMMKNLEKLYQKLKINTIYNELIKADTKKLKKAEKLEKFVNYLKEIDKLYEELAKKYNNIFDGNNLFELNIDPISYTFKLTSDSYEIIDDLKLDDKPALEKYFTTFNNVNLLRISSSSKIIKKSKIYYFKRNNDSVNTVEKLYTEKKEMQLIDPKIESKINSVNLFEEKVSSRDFITNISTLTYISNILKYKILNRDGYLLVDINKSTIIPEPEYTYFLFDKDARLKELKLKSADVLCLDETLGDFFEINLIDIIPDYKGNLPIPKNIIDYEKLMNKHNKFELLYLFNTEYFRKYYTTYNTNDFLKMLLDNFFIVGGTYKQVINFVNMAVFTNQLKLFLNYINELNSIVILDESYPSTAHMLDDDTTLTKIEDNYNKLYEVLQNLLISNFKDDKIKTKFLSASSLINSLSTPAEIKKNYSTEIITKAQTELPNFNDLLKNTELIKLLVYKVINTLQKNCKIINDLGYINKVSALSVYDTDEFISKEPSLISEYIRNNKKLDDGSLNMDLFEILLNFNFQDINIYIQNELKRGDLFENSNLRLCDLYRYSSFQINSEKSFDEVLLYLYSLYEFLLTGNKIKLNDIDKRSVKHLINILGYIMDNRNDLYDSTFMDVKTKDEILKMYNYTLLVGENNKLEKDKVTLKTINNTLKLNLAEVEKKFKFELFDFATICILQDYFDNNNPKKSETKIYEYAILDYALYYVLKTNIAGIPYNGYQFINQVILEVPDHKLDRYYTSAELSTLESKYTLGVRQQVYPFTYTPSNIYSLLAPYERRMNRVILNGTRNIDVAKTISDNIDINFNEYTKTIKEFLDIHINVSLQLVGYSLFSPQWVSAIPMYSDGIQKYSSYTNCVESSLLQLILLLLWDNTTGYIDLNILDTYHINPVDGKPYPNIDISKRTKFDMLKTFLTDITKNPALKGRDLFTTFNDIARNRQLIFDWSYKILGGTTEINTIDSKEYYKYIYTYNGTYDAGRKSYSDKIYGYQNLVQQAYWVGENLIDKNIEAIPFDGDSGNPTRGEYYCAKNLSRELLGIVYNYRRVLEDFFGIVYTDPVAKTIRPYNRSNFIVGNKGIAEPDNSEAVIDILKLFPNSSKNIVYTFDPSVLSQTSGRGYIHTFNYNGFVLFQINGGHGHTELIAKNPDQNKIESLFELFDTRVGALGGIGMEVPLSKNTMESSARTLIGYSYNRIQHDASLNILDAHSTTLKAKFKFDIIDKLYNRISFIYNNDINNLPSNFNTRSEIESARYLLRNKANVGLDRLLNNYNIFKNRFIMDKWFNNKYDIIHYLREVPDIYKTPEGREDPVNNYNKHKLLIKKICELYNYNLNTAVFDKTLIDFLLPHILNDFTLLEEILNNYIKYNFTKDLTEENIITIYNNLGPLNKKIGRYINNILTNKNSLFNVKFEDNSLLKYMIRNLYTKHINQGAYTGLVANGLYKTEFYTIITQTGVYGGDIYNNTNYKENVNINRNDMYKILKRNLNFWNNQFDNIKICIKNSNNMGFLLDSNDTTNPANNVSRTHTSKIYTNSVFYSNMVNFDDRIGANYLIKYFSQLFESLFSIYFNHIININEYNDFIKTVDSTKVFSQQQKNIIYSQYLYMENTILDIIDIVINKINSANAIEYDILIYLILYIFVMNDNVNHEYKLTEPDGKFINQIANKFLNKVRKIVFDKIIYNKTLSDYLLSNYGMITKFASPVMFISYDIDEIIINESFIVYDSSTNNILSPAQYPIFAGYKSLLPSSEKIKVCIHKISKMKEINEPLKVTDYNFNAEQIFFKEFMNFYSHKDFKLFNREKFIANYLLWPGTINIKGSNLKLDDKINFYDEFVLTPAKKLQHPLNMLINSSTNKNFSYIYNMIITSDDYLEYYKSRDIKITVSMQEKIDEDVRKINETFIDKLVEFYGTNTNFLRTVVMLILSKQEKDRLTNSDALIASGKLYDPMITNP